MRAKEVVVKEVVVRAMEVVGKEVAVRAMEVVVKEVVVRAMEVEAKEAVMRAKAAGVCPCPRGPRRPRRRHTRIGVGAAADGAEHGDELALGVADGLVGAGDARLGELLDVGGLRAGRESKELTHRRGG